MLPPHRDQPGTRRPSTPSLPRWLAVAIGGLLTLAPAAFAQINTEALRARIDSPGFSGSIYSSLGLREGNTDSLDFGLGGRLQTVLLDESCETGNDEEPETPCFARRIVFLVGSYSLSEDDDTRNANKSFGHLRWGHNFGPRYGIEAFFQHQFNEFQRLDTRLLVGFGTRIALKRGPNLEAFAGIGAMWEFERLDLPEGSLEDDEVRNGRSTNYLSVRYHPRDRGFKFVNTTYVQPRIDRPRDLRLLNEGEIQFDLGKRFGLGFVIGVTYDSEPPADVEKTDISLSNRFTVRF